MPTTRPSCRRAWQLRQQWCESFSGPGISWSRPAARWPHLVQTTEVESFTRRRELDNRRIHSEDCARIVMVPITVTALEEYSARTNGDALDPMTRTGLLDERYEQGFGIPWPPARNSRCWCGSGVKYKKCCGSLSFDT